MHNRRLLPTAAVAVGLLLGGGVLTADATPSGQNVAVSVTGSHRDGYHVEFVDGRFVHTPTWSETLAECSEYRRRVDRVRCRASERSRFRGYALLRNSLRYAYRSQPGTKTDPAWAMPLLEPCRYEDAGRWCQWDARVRGNGVGRSFWRDGQGVAHYVPPLD